MLKALALILVLALGVFLVLQINGTETGIVWIDHPVTTFLSWVSPEA